MTESQSGLRCPQTKIVRTSTKIPPYSSSSSSSSVSSADDRDAAVNALNAAPKFFSSFAVIRRSPRQEPSFSAQNAPATALFGAAAGIAANMANPRTPQRPLAQLVDVVSGESHSITSAQVTIGRERSVSDIALRDPNVSRRHAQLTFTGSDWSIEDLNSTNGTLVNNRRITRCPLRNGDLLTFGLSTFEFRG